MPDQSRHPILKSKSPEEPGRRAWTYLMRAIQLRCPECGISPIFCPANQVHSVKDWLQPLTGCPVCGYAYEREPGYFLLSVWAFNYGIIGAVALAMAFAADAFLHLPAWKIIVFVLAPIPFLNLLFARHSKSLFLAMDHFFDPHVDAKK